MNDTRIKITYLSLQDQLKKKMGKTKKMFKNGWVWPWEVGGRSGASFEFELWLDIRSGSSRRQPSRGVEQKLQNDQQRPNFELNDDDV